MTHLPYVTASFALVLVVGAAFAVDAWLRMRRAEQRLEAIDPRRQRERQREQERA